MEIDEGLDFGETDKEDEEQLVHVTKDLSCEDNDTENEDSSRSSTDGSWQADPDPWGRARNTSEEEKSSEEEDFDSAMIQSIKGASPDFQ